jgi:GTP pyrophosphokinase
VRQAYRFADEAHLGQCAAAASPTSPTRSPWPRICANWKLDAQALMAALLHDAMEDCGVTKADLIERFGAPVAELVDGLTKLDKLQFNTREKPGRVLPQDAAGHGARCARHPDQAGRPHAQHAHHGDMPRSKWGRISSETLEIYAPSRTAWA